MIFQLPARFLLLAALLFPYLSANADKNDDLRASQRVKVLSDICLSSESVSPLRADLTMLVRVENRSRSRISFQLTNDLYDPFGRKIAEGSREVTLRASAKATQGQKVTVTTPLLWSPGDPALYTLISEISQQNRPIETCRNTLGFTSVLIPDSRLAIVNGQSIPLRPVFPETLPADDDHLRRALRLAKITGSNALLLSDTISAARVAPMTDREGLLLIVSSPHRSSPLHPSLSPVAADLFAEVLTRAVSIDSIATLSGFPATSFGDYARQWQGDPAFAVRYSCDPTSADGLPASIRLTAEQESLSVADFRPAYIVAEILDSSGSLCSSASLPVTFAVKGLPDKIVHTSGGRCWIPLSGAPRKGSLRIRATSPGLSTGSVTINIF